MEIRSMDKLGIKTSLLGFGCMRFPLTKEGTIDEAEAERMLIEAKRRGVNYFDTAYPYHNGESEPLVGKILNQFPRDSYFLATKLPVWLVNSLEDAKRLFAEQLMRLQKDYVDFYLLHAMNNQRFHQMRDLGVISYLEELQKEGKIRYLGFSFHDEYATFEEMILYKDWDFCQIQLNYMDTEEQAGIKGYELAKEKGIPVIVMEPVKGGSLARFGEDINAMFRNIDPNRSIASFALRWVAALDQVKVILSGMSNWEQVEDNLNTFSDYLPLTKEELSQIDEIVQVLESRVQNGCTGCNYCMPCPFGVNIPLNFKVWNTYHVYHNYDAISWTWEKEMAESEKAANCVLCGKCETLCPQQITIREDLKLVQRDLDLAEFK